MRNPAFLAAAEPLAGSFPHVRVLNEGGRLCICYRPRFRSVVAAGLLGGLTGWMAFVAAGDVADPDAAPFGVASVIFAGMTVAFIAVAVRLACFRTLIVVDLETVSIWAGRFLRRLVAQIPRVELVAVEVTSTTLRWEPIYELRLKQNDSTATRIPFCDTDRVLIARVQRVLEEALGFHSNAMTPQSSGGSAL